MPPEVDRAPILTLFEVESDTADTQYIHMTAAVDTAAIAHFPHEQIIIFRSQDVVCVSALKEGGSPSRHAMPNKSETLAQCWLNVGPPAPRWASIKPVLGRRLVAYSPDLMLDLMLGQRSRRKPSLIQHLLFVEIASFQFAARTL